MEELNKTLAAIQSVEMELANLRSHLVGLVRYHINNDKVIEECNDKISDYLLSKEEPYGYFD